MTFLHLVWTSRFREQKNQKCCLTCADVSYHTDRVLFWERAGGLRGCEGSFLVKSKCMACGSLKKKKKKCLSHTFAMAAHIPQSHGDENHCLKRKSKKDENGRVIPSSLQCHYFALFQPNSFSFFFPPCALLRSFILKQETLNCQKLHSSLRRHRAQPHSNSANRSSFPQPAGE